MIALGLGSNVGDREDYIRRTVDKLSHYFSIDKVSSIYETKAWGEENQPDFLNACLTAETDKTPEEVLSIIKKIEADLGRTETYRWGPREIDIDILLFDDKQISSQRLTIPHPQLTDRAFVLVPLAQIVGDLLDPNTKLPISTLAIKLDNSSVQLFAKY
jgi:2-amino-4-hydroxy-6-hydroxymethyldihydropteridine diphosphokinase